MVLTRLLSIIVATSAALDSESEKKVVKALQRALAHAESMVMVTHRLGVVRSLDVNRVIVMDQGKVVESGHPEDLLRKRDGLYFSLASEQGITALEEPRKLRCPQYVNKTIYFKMNSHKERGDCDRRLSNQRSLDS